LTSPQVDQSTTFAVLFQPSQKMAKMWPC